MGTWKVTTSPPAEFWLNSVDPSGWTDIAVPGELTAQGIAFARDNEFACKRSIGIPAETFLEACDKYGVYVEDESAVCFVHQQWSITGGSSGSDPEFTARYMNHFAEMIALDRSHPSVI